MSGTSYHRTSWKHRQPTRSRTGWIDTGKIWAFKADSYIAHHPQVTSNKFRAADRYAPSVDQPDPTAVILHRRFANYEDKTRGDMTFLAVEFVHPQTYEHAAANNSTLRSR